MRASGSSDNQAAGAAGEVLFADDEARALLEGQLAELSAPDPERWEKVKQNVSRTVYRGRIGDQEVYLKHFHGQSLAHRLARKLGMSRARHEYEISRHLRSCGVATPAPLAARCDEAGHWYAMRAIRSCERGSAWHARMIAEGPGAAARVRQALVALAKLIARMHRAGVLHCDLHCGNVLVRTDTDKVKLILMDLHRAKRRRGFSRRSRSANLAQLFHDRFVFTTRTQRLRFLKHYLSAAGAEGSLRGWQLMVEGFARRHTRHLYSRRDRRIGRDNKYFHNIRLPGGWRGHVVLASKYKMAGSSAAELVFDVESWRRALADPAGLLNKDEGEIFKDSPSSLVIRRSLQVGGTTLNVFVKQHRRKRAWKALADCFRPARALRAFRLGHELLTRRIATALPLAALERRVGPLLTHSILITETIDAPRANQFLNKWLGQRSGTAGELDNTQKQMLAYEVLRQLGRLLQRLPGNKLVHRDLKASNILIRWDGRTTPEVALIDLDGLQHARRPTARRSFQGLMRLNVSLLECPVVNRTGRLRMLLGYLRRPGSGPINFKPYWRVLARWSARKLRDQIRSRRKRQKAFRRPAT